MPAARCPSGAAGAREALQLTLSCIGPDDTLKVIDQGSDASVNAVSIRGLVRETTGVETTTVTQEATLIQSRPRIPEHPLTRDQLLVLQVPTPEPLRTYEARETVTKRSSTPRRSTQSLPRALFEQIVRYGTTTTGADHPVMVEDRYVMAPSPIPALRQREAQHGREPHASGRRPREEDLRRAALHARGVARLR